ncbi:hypothetical protein GQ53DRAFT_620316, partial [Thozetella sp. PMI_491]
SIPSILLGLISIVCLTIFGTQRVCCVHTWRQLPVSSWLILAIYIDSSLFIMAQIVIQNAGINNSPVVCRSAIIICVTFYLLTKVLVYYFLIERAYIVRGRSTNRLKDRWYLVHSVGMILPYCGMGLGEILALFSDIRDARCYIGNSKEGLIPLIISDIMVNTYLTAVFLVSIRNLQSFEHNARLRRMAIRTLIGVIVTLTSTILNASLLWGLNGEQAWLCLDLCTLDVLFTTFVLHWIISDRHESTSDPNGENQN